MTFSHLLEQLGLQQMAEGTDVRVHFGGPVEHGRGFVLHTADYPGGEATLRVDGRFSMTATMDILQAIAEGRGPERFIMALGYAGWGPGQAGGGDPAQWLADGGGGAGAGVFDAELGQVGKGTQDAGGGPGGAVGGCGAGLGARLFLPGTRRLGAAGQRPSAPSGGRFCSGSA
ncbi:hypothetical protein FALB51S_00590 [Frigidibacter albus]